MTPVRYQCNLCGKIVHRVSRKLWVKSYCDTKDSYSRLYRVKRKSPVKQSDTTV